MVVVLNMCSISDQVLPTHQKVMRCLPVHGVRPSVTCFLCFSVHIGQVLKEVDLIIYCIYFTGTAQVYSMCGSSFRLRDVHVRAISNSEHVESAYHSLVKLCRYYLRGQVLWNRLTEFIRTEQVCTDNMFRNR